MTQRRPPDDDLPAAPPRQERDALVPRTLVAPPVGSTLVAGGPGAEPGGEADPLIGQELCGYTVRRKLAEGGMGVVYEGVHRTLGRLGAIKVLKPELCQSNVVVERFHQEARAVNAIRHENIVDIVDFGRDAQGRVFFVMEYLEGEPLAARIRRGPLPWAEAFPLLDQTLRALRAAHDRGFVHRDLKPDNIWLKPSDGRVVVKLLDFGIAKLVGPAAGSGERLTQTGSLIGTPAYMSPEQIGGAPDLDQRTDVYALGVILYEMFAGQPPFAGDTVQSIIAGHLFTAPPRLTNLPPDVPPGIADLVDRMLVKEPSGRCGSVAEVLAALQALNQGQVPAPAPAPAGRGGTQMLETAPVAVARRAPLLPLLLLLVAGAGAAAWRWRHAKPPAAPAVALADYGALRAQAQETLRASLRQPLAPVRVLGADALGKIHDQPSLPALTDLTERDPDAEVRGHSATALGALGDSTVAPRLAKLEQAAPAPLKVWYAAALARLGDAGAAGRLADYAGGQDLSVAFPAALLLADASAPGDGAAVAALKKLAGREAELVRRDPVAPVTLAMKLAALRDAGAHQYLVGLLQHPNAGARLAAAEALAKLGDGAGRSLLAATAADPASPDRLVAALAQIPLGDTTGAPVIARAAADPAPEIRRLAARGLGELGDRQNLPALVRLAGDPDWTVRVVAARALVEVVGLDPLLLSRAAVDWTRSALDSQDLAVRRAAAGALAAVPSGEALPLLARAIADRDPAVRRNAARSAGKMKSAAAAAQIAAAARQETDLAVKEQQVRALGEIGAVGGAPARETLARISAEPGRVGVLAAGSLIAAGDATGKSKLDAAITASSPELRAAAVEAAGLAHDPVVVPTLRAGLGDRLFQVRLLAAEGLSLLDSDKEAAVPVLAEGLSSDDAGVLSRAITGLLRFGDRVKEMVQASAALLDSADPARRMAVAPIAKALPAGDASAVLHRMVADLDRDVRRAATDAIDGLADRDLALALYRPLLADPDAGLRAIAAGQLARLVPPAPGQPPVIEAPPPPAPASPAAPPAPVQQAMAAERSAMEALEARRAPLDQLLGELARATAAPARDDASLDRVRALRKKLEEQGPALDAAAATVDRAAATVRAAAGATPSEQTTALVTEADGLSAHARDTAGSLRERADGGARRAGEYVREWTGDAQLDIDAANAKVAIGDLSGARRLLDHAARQLHKSHGKSPTLDYAYAQLFERMADEAGAPDARRAWMERALDAYRRVSGTGGRLRDVASAKVARLTDQLGATPRP